MNKQFLFLLIIPFFFYPHSSSAFFAESLPSARAFFDFQIKICDLVNKRRAMYRKNLVTLDTALMRVAQTFAEDMNYRNYFSHLSPEGIDLGWRLRKIHYHRLAGENIAWGYENPVDVVNGWMNSPGHRRNILQPIFSKMGVGHSGKYWVQVFTD